MHSMQLFIKVEEEANERRHYSSNPKFYQVTTSCEFSLVQVLENILGGNLLHYEIVGPGPWVTWTTLTSELQGQQLTLLYHNQPVAHTRAAIYGPTQTDTELMQRLVTPNIPANIDTQDDETHLKVFDYTQIESLKYVPNTSDPFTNSKNLTFSEFLERERCDFESSLVQGPIKTYTSLDYQDYELTMEHETQVKSPEVDMNNTPEYSTVVKMFPDKLLGNDVNNTNDSNDMILEQNPLQVLNNVPRFSILEQNVSPISSSTQIPTLQSTQNPPFQITKHSSIQMECEKKQNNLNNLSCVTLTTNPFSSNLQNSQTVQNTTSSDTPTSKSLVRSGSSLHQNEQGIDNVLNVDGSANQSSACPEINMTLLNTDLATSSFSQNRESQQIDVSMYSPSIDYVPHSCIHTVGGQLQSLNSVTNHLQCQFSGPIITPPQKRHKFGDVAASTLISSQQHIQQHHQLQQQILLEKQALELKHLKLQQLQEQVQASFQIAEPNLGRAQAIDPQNYQQQQLQNHLTSVPQTSELHNQQTFCLKRSSLSEQGQISNHQHLENTNQVTHLPSFSQQQFPHSLQTNQQQHSHRDIESVDQPFLVYHAGPPRFPDEESQHNFHIESGFKQKQLEESQTSNKSSIQQSNTVVPFRDQASHVINTSARSGQYLTMIKPPSANIENSNTVSSCLLSQNGESPDRPMPAMLPNFELTVRLPQQDSNRKLSDPKVILNFRNQFRNTSGTSSLGSPVESGSTFAQNGAVFVQRNEHGPLMTSSPLSSTSHTQPSFANSSVTSRKKMSCGNIVPDDDGYNCIENSHFPRHRSLPVNKWPSPATPKRAGYSLDTELMHMEGWCPHENGDTIQNAMDKHCSKDGSYIVWKSRRYNKFIISMRHLSKLFHFLVEETKHENRDRTIYYLFEGGFRSESLLDLLQHYRQNNVRITVQAKGGKKTHIEHLQLCHPFRLDVKRKGALRSS